MRPSELKTLAARHVPGRGAPALHRLSAGLVNESYRVVRDGEVYALRIAASAAQRPSGRTWECRVLERVAAAGLAPAVAYCDPAAGILITRWVPGRSWMPPRQESGAARIAALLQRIHAVTAPQPPRKMTPAAWIEHYASLGAAPREAAAARLRQAAAARLRELERLPAAIPVLCHGDLHPLNLVDCDHALVVLDWEYAQVADPFWDLAGWSSATDLTGALRRELLGAYRGGDPTALECARFELLVWLFDYVCLLWSEQYLSRTGAAEPAAAGVSARARLLENRLLRRPVVASGKFRHTTRPE